MIGTYDGLKSSEKDYIELFHSMGATRRQSLLKLHIPMALPSFFSGLKLAIVFALVGAAIGEWFGASKGLGYYSRRMSGNLNAEGVFAAITILALIGVLLFHSFLPSKTEYYDGKSNSNLTLTDQSYEYMELDKY